MVVSTSEIFMKKISNSFERQGYSDWVLKDFGIVRDHRMIQNLLSRAYTETAERDYKNRHGLAHGLATAYNALRLFELLNNETVKSDYVDILELSKDEVLFVLMTAGLIHDTGRFYDDAVKDHQEYVGDAISILEKALAAGIILSDPDRGRIKSEEMLKRIKELCLCHDKKHEPSGKVEIALMKLADALDVGPHRVYTSEDKPELSTDQETFLSKIFEKDKHPGRYFGPKSIENVDFEYDENEQFLKVLFRIKDYACAEEIKKTIDILTLAAHNSHDNVRDFGGMVHIYVETPPASERNICRIYPTPSILSQMQARKAHIPQAIIPSIEYKFDILNESGDTDIDLPLQIKNVNNKKGIPGHTAFVGGDFPSNWDDIGIKWFEETESGMRDLPPPEYLRSEGLRHQYRINFGRRLGIGEHIKLHGKARWNRFIKVMDSCMEHIVATSTTLLKFHIQFPQEVTERRVTAFFKIKNPEGRVLCCSPIEPKKIGGRWAITSEISELELHYTYGAYWKL
jgi:metal-dependent HD superfamily phosphatase/phosphodiesterase